MPSFSSVYGLDAALSTAVDLVRGLGVLTDIEVVDVEGVTPGYDTDYAAQLECALDALADGADLFIIHVEATDEAGHAGDVHEKIRALENWDSVDPHRARPGARPARPVAAAAAARPRHAAAAQDPHRRPGALPAGRLPPGRSRRRVHRGRGGRRAGHRRPRAHAAPRRHADRLRPPIGPGSDPATAVSGSDAARPLPGQGPRRRSPAAGEGGGQPVNDGLVSVASAAPAGGMVVVGVAVVGGGGGGQVDQVGDHLERVLLAGVGHRADGEHLQQLAGRDGHAREVEHDGARVAGGGDGEVVGRGRAGRPWRPGPGPAR